MNPFLVFIDPQQAKVLALIGKISVIYEGISSVQDEIVKFGIDYARKSRLARDLKKLNEIKRQGIAEISSAEVPENTWN